MNVGLAPQLVRVLGLSVLGESLVEVVPEPNLAPLLHAVDAADGGVCEVGAGSVRSVPLVLGRWIDR